MKKLQFITTLMLFSFVISTQGIIASEKSNTRHQSPKQALRNKTVGTIPQKMKVGKDLQGRKTNAQAAQTKMTSAQTEESTTQSDTTTA